MKCEYCECRMPDNALNCPHCGAPVRIDFQKPEPKPKPQPQPASQPEPWERQRPVRSGPVSDKNRWVALLLCLLMGWLGVHRFYVGKIGTGILWLFTGGFWGIGTFVDLVRILCGTFRDKEGRPLK